MSTFSNSESATASPSETQTNPRNNGEQSRQSGWLDEESSDDGTPTLEMDRCPECGARRFVSKLLVYEVTSFDEGGQREFRRQHVRAEFEYTCSECQTILRRLPADRRDYYDEVNVLEVERRAALRDQLRQLCRRVGRRLWVTKSWIALVLLTIATMVVWL
jgi:DNA-directed RNA polymerase subunit RPC12/RpoP